MALNTWDRRDEDDLQPRMAANGVASRAAQRETLVLHTPTAAITEQRALTNDASNGRYGELPDSPAGAAMATSRTVVRDVAAERHRTISQINQVVWFVIGCVEVLLTLRMALKLLGANPAADFTQAIYGVSAPLIAPFMETFPSSVFGGFEFEPASAVAMLVWFLAGIGIGRLVWILHGEPHRGD